MDRARGPNSAAASVVVEAAGEATSFVLRQSRSVPLPGPACAHHWAHKSRPTLTTWLPLGL